MVRKQAVKSLRSIRRNRQLSAMVSAFFKSD
jgi:hypothetical protein